MRVLIVSCVFPPEPVVSGRTSVHIAQELVVQGHDVEVITSFPSKPAGILYPKFKRRLYKKEITTDGFILRRCFSFLSTESRLLDRFLENISFGLTSGFAVLFAKRPHVIYSNTWPLFSTGIVFLMAKLRRIPLVISVQDVYPESLVSQQRALSMNLLIRALRWWDGVIARGCHSVIVISQKFFEIYSSVRGVSPHRIHVVPNWGNDESDQIDPARFLQFRKDKQIVTDARVFVFGGNIGIAAGVEIIIQAVLQMKPHEKFHLLIAGEGSQLDACQALARSQDGRHIIFHSPWLKEETNLVLGLADVFLLPTKGRQAYFSVPSKLISYWLAGKPVIALALPNSDLADMISLSGGGWLVEPDKLDILSAKMEDVLGIDPSELKRRGQAGREYALRNLTRQVCLPKVIKILTEAGIKG